MDTVSLAMWQAPQAGAKAIEAARQAAGADGMGGFVHHGPIGVGLACNALARADSGRGGTSAVDGERTIRLETPAPTLSDHGDGRDDRPRRWAQRRPGGQPRGIVQAGSAAVMRQPVLAEARSKRGTPPLR